MPIIYIEKMSYNDCLVKDRLYGFDQEEKMKEIIEKALDIKLERSDKNAVYDFINKDKKILIELKSRRCRKNQYKTTMISCHKIGELLKKVEEGYTVYLFFNYLDCVCYYEFTQYNKDWVSVSGRWDRFRDELNNYYFIPIEELIDLP